MFYVIVIWGDLMNTYGSRIKAARESANLTQEGLGQKLGVTGVTIMRYEKNQREPRQDQFKRLAAALNVDVNWLMNGYTLEQRDQASKDYVKERFTEAKEWKTRLDEIGQDLGKLNDEGQVEAVKRVKELTEIEKYKYKRKPSPLSAGITVYRDDPAGSSSPAHQPPPRDETPGRGTDTTPPPEGTEGPGEWE